VLTDAASVFRVRALERLEQLYAVGGGPGANRIGYSPEEDEAHALARGWLEGSRLEVEVDESGNLFGRSASSPGIWTGSHLDTVPQGASSTARSAWSLRSRPLGASAKAP
jgi:acetylornithine deacetylase/succinyl-diaminopimelate desuccinylase-like protein